MADRDTSRLVFILCTERSGSTLLSAMLGSHSRVFAPTELHMLHFRTVAEWRRGYPPASTSLDSLVKMTGARLPRDLESMAPEDLYREILAQSPPGSRIVDKTPAYARDPDALSRAEAFEPYYVWLIRHPVPVALSRIRRRSDARRARNRGLLARVKYPAFLVRDTWRRWSGSALREKVREWVDMQQRIQAHLADLDRGRWRTVHYERLVRDPRGTMEALCELLGIEFEAAMLDPRRHAPPGIGYGIADETFLQREGIEAGIADEWRKEFDESALDPETLAFARSLGVEVAPR